MPAYNPPPQVLFSPVTNHYQGKAIRAGLASQELANEELQQRVDANLPERQIGVREQMAETAAGNLETRIDEYGLAVGKDKALEEANTIIGITEGAGSAEDPVAYANERMAEFIETLPEGEGRDKLEAMAVDGFSAAEMKEVHAFAMAVNRQFSSAQTSKPSNQVNMYHPETGEQRAVRPESQDASDLAASGWLVGDPSSGSGGPNFEPPNSIEMEAAVAVVEGIPELDALNTEDRAIAAQMIANDVRQLQANNEGMAYETALATAITNVIKNVIKEPGKLWGTNSKLQKLEDNEFLVNGAVYIKDENGIRPKP